MAVQKQLRQTEAGLKGNFELPSTDEDAYGWHKDNGTKVGQWMRPMKPK